MKWVGREWEASAGGEEGSRHLLSDVVHETWVLQKRRTHEKLANRCMAKEMGRRCVGQERYHTYRAIGTGAKSQTWKHHKNARRPIHKRTPYASLGDLRVQPFL